MSKENEAELNWVSGIVDFNKEHVSADEAMLMAISLARANLTRGGGPFGSVITDAQGKIVEVGWNSVIQSVDSTAHAEIVAMRRGQRKIGTHDFSKDPTGPFVLYSSAAPCIHCFGAIYWSGLSKVYAAARKEDVEAIGFDEGPVTPALWQEAKEKRNIEYVPDLFREQAVAVLKLYQSGGGNIY